MIVLARLTTARLGGDVAGGLMLASAGLIALLQEAPTPPEQAFSALAGTVTTILTAGGIGYFLIQTAAKEWTKAKDNQRAQEKEEREHERQREVAKEAFQLAQLQLWQLAFSEERKRNETLVNEVIQRISCTPVPAKPLETR